jgi:hypothetical protein
MNQSINQSSSFIINHYQHNHRESLPFFNKSESIEYCFKILSARHTHAYDTISFERERHTHTHTHTHTG